ncbi:MAG: hypothetical protein KAS69_02000 [Planctomycetes bacterium]|nr:hypothetical protein [Planctomycetota bacterium]
MNSEQIIYDDKDLLLEDLDVHQDDLLDVKVGGRLIFTIIILATISAVLSDIPSTQGGIYLAAKIMLAAFVFISFAAPGRWGILIFMIVLLTGKDISQAAGEMKLLGEFTTASVWNLNIGPIRPSWLMATGTIIHIIKMERIKMKTNIKIAMLWFATVPLLTMLLYRNYTEYSAKFEIINDIKVGVMLLLSIILFSSFLSKNPQYIGLITAGLTGSLLGRHLVDLAYWFLEIGSQFAGIVRVSVDSAAGGIVFMLLLGVYLIFMKKRFVIGSFLGLAGCLLLIGYATRMFWVTALMGFVVLFMILGFKHGLLVLPIMFAVVFGGIILINALRPETALVISKRAETFGKSTGAGGNFLQNLDPLRYGEVINSFNTSFRHGALIFGNGYGSYYRDDVIAFPRTLTDAFNEYSAATGKFYRIHNYLFHMFFKYGLVGTIIITSLWVVPGWKCYKISKSNPTMLDGLLAVIIAFIPTAMIQLYWSGKGLFINGVIIGILWGVIEQVKNSQTYLSEEGDETLDISYEQ